MMSESDVRGLLGIDDKCLPSERHANGTSKIGAEGAARSASTDRSWAGGALAIGCTVRDAQSTALEVEVA